MPTWSVACVMLCFVLSALCTPRPQNGELDDIVKQIEKIKSVHERQEDSHHQILGVFEPTEAYFNRQEDSREKRVWYRRYMRCLKFDRATRRCSRYAMVGVWK